ncbi:MAG: hypothetical protein HY821_19725 [Acidobacteria bacterium]|nr:hypothetical protein [Acidobacteriota bacterium]
MRRTKVTVLILACAAVFAADDWAKVKELKSGSDLKIHRVGKPVLEAKMDQATEESLLVATKKEQLSIPKEEIVRIEARAPGGKPVTTTTSTTGLGEVPGTDPHKMNRPGGSGGGPSGSMTTSKSWSGPSYETVYRRVSGSPKKQ